MCELMARDEECSSLQAESIQSQPRASMHEPDSTGLRLHNKCSRMSRVEDRLNLRQVSRATSHASSSGNKYSICSKSLQTSTKMEIPSQSVSSIDEKLDHVRSLPNYKNGTNGFSGSYDSESDADIEIDLDAIASNISFRSHRTPSFQAGTSAATPIQSSRLLVDSNISKGKFGSSVGRLRNGVGEGLNHNGQYWDASSSKSSQSLFSDNSNVRIRNPRNLPKSSGNQLRGKMKCDDESVCFTSDIEKAQGAGSSVSSYGSSILGEMELPGNSFKAYESSSAGRNLGGCHCGLTPPTSNDDAWKERLDVEASCLCKVGNNRCEDPNMLHGKFIRNKASKHFREPGIGRHDFVCKRKNYDQGSLGSRPLGFSRESRRRDFGNLGCLSSSDGLSSSSNINPNSSHCLKPLGSSSISNKRGTVKSQRSGKNPAPSLAVGCLPYRNSRDESGGLSSERNSSKANLLTMQPVRKSCSSFPSEVWCSRSLQSVEQKSVISSGAFKGINQQSTFRNRWCRETSPSVSRSKTISRSSVRLGGDGFATYDAHDDVQAHRNSASSSRVASAVNSCGNQIGTLGLESGYSFRSNREDSGTNSARGLALNNKEMPSSSTVFRSPPFRPPLDFPTLAANQRHSGYYPSSSTSSFVNNSNFQHLCTFSERNDLPNTALGPRFRQSVASPEATFDAHDASVSSMGSLHCRSSSQESQKELTRENQPRMMMEGLSEILAALEDAERDDTLSYEHILMLEATILLGGMGLHDQYRDMRLDVDNMSYEELLALEEQIGNVSTGLSVDDVVKCVSRSRYTSVNVSSNYVPQGVEVKCSICQEDFIEDTDLGLLGCGHSYHIPCIKEWLLQKNQCPICKAPAIS